MTSGKGVDVVFDSVAGPTWKLSLSVLRPGGRLVLAGTTGGDVVTHDLSDVFYNQWSLLGCRMGDGAEFGQMLRAIDTSLVKPKIAATYPLSATNRAHAKMESGDFVGKLVLEV
jgi:zinc-binding alcohol dehydrogenase/oxidoreductase